MFHNSNLFPAQNWRRLHLVDAQTGVKRRDVKSVGGVDRGHQRFRRDEAAAGPNVGPRTTPKSFIVTTNVGVTESVVEARIDVVVVVNDVKADATQSVEASCVQRQNCVALADEERRQAPIRRRRQRRRRHQSRKRRRRPNF